MQQDIHGIPRHEPRVKFNPSNPHIGHLVWCSTRSSRLLIRNLCSPTWFFPLQATKAKACRLGLYGWLTLGLNVISGALQGFCTS